MGSMKFDDIRQCGKELGPMTSISIPPTASYQDIIEKAKQQFFAAAACHVILMREDMNIFLQTRKEAS